MKRRRNRSGYANTPEGYGPSGVFWRLRFSMYRNMARKIQSRTGIRMVNPMEIFRHRNAAGWSMSAKIRVAKYRPANRAAPAMAKIRFAFFIRNPF